MLVVIPAYGRDYKSAKEAKAAWAEGKDFQIVSVGPEMGRYVSSREYDGKVEIRFKNNRNLVIV